MSWGWRLGVFAWLELYESQACSPTGCTPGVCRTNHIFDLGVSSTFDIRISLVYLAVSSMPYWYRLPFSSLLNIITFTKAYLCVYLVEPLHLNLTLVSIF